MSRAELPFDNAISDYAGRRIARADVLRNSENLISPARNVLQQMKLRQIALPACK
jgi:hypothetical protein